MNIFKENKKTYTNYFWTDTLPSGLKRSQQIALQATGAKNRGNYLATYDVIHNLIDIKNDFANYYFSELIGSIEVEEWAKLISETINDTIIDVKTDRFVQAENNNYFSVNHEDKIVEFKSGTKVSIFMMTAISKTNLFVIDCNDLFPRYYLNEVSLESESSTWIDVRKQEIID